MQIQEVALTVTGLAAAARFYHDVLELPVAEQPGQATVTIGSSRLVLEEGDQFAGAHHLAIGIAPAEFRGRPRLAEPACRTHRGGWLRGD